MRTKEILIDRVIEGSIAEEAGIEKGDILVSINGSPIHDMIEYKFLTSDEYMTLLVRKKNKEEWEIEIEKEYNEDIGIEFEDTTLGNAKRCHNKCMFCFIDQLPKGMRESLYFKDDDSTLSFLHGNFITLTNMGEEDIDRIIRYRISPINVSVHTTNPELRIKMLNNKKAGNIMEILKRLTNEGILINCQIVLCPGVNDGIELQRTLEDLYSFYPQIENVAIVPVGITRYREGLIDLGGFDRESSRELIELMQSIQAGYIKEAGTPFARLADEFYVMAEMELPPPEHYGDFEQLEDGIGMIRYLEERIEDDLKDINFNGNGRKVGVVTGASGSKYLRDILSRAGKVLNMEFIIHKVDNKFFGGRITVAGLITGKDIIEQLKGIIKEDITLIPSNMFKVDEDVLLDDMKISELEKELDTKLVKCKYTGDDLIDIIVNEVI